MMATVLTGLTALVATRALPAVIRSVVTGIVAITAARAKDRPRRRDAQKTLEILVPPEPDEKAPRRGRKRAVRR